jgi:vacuolar-type H+-ATPase subunit F/Vma7
VRIGCNHRRDAARACRRWRFSSVPGACNLFVVLTLLCVGGQAFAQEVEVEYQEEQAKAAFLYHFATFVQWPETSRSDRVFVIAVLGADGVAAELEEFLPGRAIQGRSMEVRRLRTIDELQDAAVIFVGADESATLPELIRRVEDRPMLVVTEVPGALENGSMINFQLVDQRVRFEISLTAAERAGLELSSRLLSAATFVDATSAVARRARVAYASICWTNCVRGVDVAAI